MPPEQQSPTPAQSIPPVSPNVASIPSRQPAPQQVPPAAPPSPPGVPNTPVPPPPPEGGGGQTNAKWILIVGVIIVILALAGVAFAIVKQGGDNVSDDKDGKEEKGSFLGFGSGGGGNCAGAYQELLDANKYDFSKCGKTAIRGGSYKEKDVVDKTTDMVLIFDASGSMAGMVDGGKKIDVAKEAAKEFLNEAAGDDLLNLSVVVYGHKGSNSPSDKAVSCRGIEEIINLGPVHAASAKNKIDSFSATGWTPIADSLLVAQDILENGDGDASIVLLVSDGQETCGGDPVSVVRKLRNSSSRIVTSVIGFDVAGDDEAQLEAIAEAGGGDYHSVKNALELQKAFERHENMLDQADFEIGRVIEELYDVGYVINTYNQCQMGLRREEAAMMLDIHASKLVGEKCEDYADGEYYKRFNQLEAAFKRQYEEDMAAFNQIR